MSVLRWQFLDGSYPRGYNPKGLWGHLMEGWGGLVLTFHFNFSYKETLKNFGSRGFLGTLPPNILYNEENKIDSAVNKNLC